MKTLALAAGAAALLAGSIAAGAETIGLEDRVAIIDTITDIAAGADRHQWDRLRRAFAGTVTLDYTSLWGGEPTTQSGEAVVAQWSGFLPGFEQTLHLVTNHTVVESNGTTATAEADFQAIHRIGADMWVLMGHYRYDLTKADGDWKVSRLVMTHTHETGDRGLVERAAERATRSN